MNKYYTIIVSIVLIVLVIRGDAMTTDHTTDESTSTEAQTASITNGATDSAVSTADSGTTDATQAAAGSTADPGTTTTTEQGTTVTTEPATTTEPMTTTPTPFYCANVTCTDDVQTCLTAVVNQSSILCNDTCQIERTSIGGNYTSACVSSCTPITAMDPKVVCCSTIADCLAVDWNDSSPGGNNDGNNILMSSQIAIIGNVIGFLLSKCLSGSH